VRALRAVRVIRVVRLMQFFTSLRLLVESILGTLQSLVWTVLLLLFILYVFAVIFAQASIDYLVSNTAETNDALEYYFGDLPITIYTLFKAISGGVSWQDVAESLNRLHWSSPALFVVFIAFVYIVVLNVVTGVFCQTALENAANDKDFLMEEHMALKKRESVTLAELFKNMDTDHDDTLTLAEFEEALRHNEVRECFETMDLTVHDALHVFRMLDCNHTFGVNSDEFVEGCLRLKGNAKNVDLAMFMFESRLMLKQIHSIVRISAEEITRLKQSLVI